MWWQEVAHLSKVLEARETITDMNSVWLLWFEQEREDSADTQLLIGVYRTEENARAAIERVKDQPGICDYPEGFDIYERSLDTDSWTEGFVRV